MSKNRETLLKQMPENPLAPAEFDLEQYMEDLEAIRDMMKEAKKEALALHDRIQMLTNEVLLLTKSRDHFKRLYEDTLHKSGAGAVSYATQPEE